jgi:hypothetical protein
MCGMCLTTHQSGLEAGRLPPASLATRETLTVRASSDSCTSRLTNLPCDDSCRKSGALNIKCSLGLDIGRMSIPHLVSPNQDIQHRIEETRLAGADWHHRAARGRITEETTMR